MTMQITINKTGAVFQTGDFPQAARDFIFSYGLRQILNDCHASLQRKDFDSQEDFVAAVNDRVKVKLAALESGDITTRQSGGASLDPMTKLIYAIAREEFLAKAKAKAASMGKKFVVKSYDPEKIAQAVEKYLQDNKARIDNEAKKRLEAKAKQASAPIDLDFDSLI